MFAISLDSGDGLNGLSQKSSAPAAFDCSRRCGVSSAVSMTIGTWAMAGICRNRMQTSMPSMPGIEMSSSTKSSGVLSGNLQSLLAIVSRVKDPLGLILSPMTILTTLTVFGLLFDKHDMNGHRLTSILDPDNLERLGNTYLAASMKNYTPGARANKTRLMRLTKLGPA